MTPSCGNCNVLCNSSQSYCSLGRQSISSMVGDFSGFNVKTDDFIWEKWTTSKWNELQNKYATANSLGMRSSQGASLSFTPAQKDMVITADLYNEIAKASQAFGGSTPYVSVDQLITADLSDALDNGFAGSKFRSGVCDVCNSGTQHNCGYNCACNYNCCNYNCNCNYQCSCNHQCSCNKPEDENTYIPVG